MNRRFTEELLALLFKSRARRMKRLQPETEEPGRPNVSFPRRAVSNEEFFSASPIGVGLVNPNAARYKRIRIG